MSKGAERPTIPDFVARFAAYREENPAWGSLHVALDDGNVSDDQVRHCRAWASEKGDAEGEVLAGMLLALTRTQRLRLPRAVDAFLEAKAAAEPTGMAP